MLKANKIAQIFLFLYKNREITKNDIYREFKTGCTKEIKYLIDKKILVETDKFKKIRQGRGETITVVFKIDQNKIDEIFLNWTVTRTIYDRIMNGQMKMR